MVLRELLELSTAQAIDPAVPDVRHAHAFVGESNRDDRGAHASLPGALLRGAVNDFIRQSNGAGQAIGRAADSLDVLAGEGQRRISLRLAAVLEHRVHGHPAGDFARLQSSHPVREDEETHLRRDAEAVLVVFADASRVAPRAEFHLRRHSCL